MKQKKNGESEKKIAELQPKTNKKARELEKRKYNFYKKYEANILL